MDLRVIINVILFTVCKATINENKAGTGNVPDNVFNGVYSECFLHLSYLCLQKKTLLYLKELNNLSEVSVIGDYVKFVKINESDYNEVHSEEMKTGETEELAFMIDKAIDNFFDNHVLKFYAMGRNISMPRNVEGFVGRKKRRGGGGGGGHGGGHEGGGHDDGGKKKMMMMAMMCMKMKLMMMVPAMMGMMGMMSFKGMMFSMMSFMISKMMLLMKILEKKGGGGGLGGGGGGGGLDGGWPAGGAGGGAWMPAGGQDYAGGGGGGGYDANGQWQSRSIVENLENYRTIDNYPKFITKPLNNIKKDKDNKRGINDKWFNEVKTVRTKPTKRTTFDENPVQAVDNKPEISFVRRTIRFNNKEKEKESYKDPVLVYKRSNVNFDFNDPENESFENNYNTDSSNTRSKRNIESKQQTLYFNKHEHTTQDQNDKENTNTYNDNRKSKIESKSRQKRSVLDLLQKSYIYWVNQILGLNNNRRTTSQKYRIVNGIKYVYYPYRLQKLKMPKGIPMISQNEDFKPLVAEEEFNKGEIVDGVESRMMHKKLKKMKDTLNDTVEENPWE